MSDYRDDRGALRQRVEALEADLQQSRTRNEELEAELLSAREERKKPPTPKLRAFARGPVPMAAGLAIIVGGMVLLAIVLRSPSPAVQVVAKAPTPVQPPSPVPRKPPEPAPRVASETCRCVGANDERVSLVYRANGSMSLGGNSTYFLNAGLRMSGASGERETELHTGLETVPPGKLEGGDDRFVLGCLDDRMVLALGHRVSAWALEDGRQLWSSTLPAPVGHAENGPLRIECDTAPVKNGIVTLTHAGGATRIDAKDGSQKAK